jgi:hypothetical protein
VTDDAEAKQAYRHQLRRSFESWSKLQGLVISRNHTGRYSDGRTESAFRAFRAGVDVEPDEIRLEEFQKECDEFREACKPDEEIVIEDDEPKDFKGLGPV